MVNVTEDFLQMHSDQHTYLFSHKLNNKNIALIKMITAMNLISTQDRFSVYYLSILFLLVPMYYKLNISLCA